MKRVFIEILSESPHVFNPVLIKRDLQINPGIKKVQTIIGPRRSGKSSLLALSVNQLLENGTGWDKICLVSFEDERLRKDYYDPDLLLQAFRELNPGNAALKDVYFFLDEIQYLPQWEFFVNRVYEKISKNIIITGSNGRTLHADVASVLRGRGLPFEVLPLSFAEYLRFRNIEFDEYGIQKSVVLATFNEYLLWGGYPEIVLPGYANKRDVLQEYFNTVLYRDILEQKQGAGSYLRYLFHRIAGNTGKNLSLRKIYQELKSRGYAVSQESIYQAADLAEAVYLFKRIGKYDPSLIKSENSDKKCYFVDNGILHAIDSSFSNNLGSLLENLVFWQLYRLYGNIYTTGIYYYKDAYCECDFIIHENGVKPRPVQVCISLKDSHTKQREMKGLLKACRFCEVKKGFIITLDEEEKFWVNNIEVEVIPAWKWSAKNVKFTDE
ncbi:MAG: ATP-binding protein [Lentimicrobium sp.]